MKIVTICNQAELTKVLETDVTALRVLEKNKLPKKGQLVGIRLNLNILRNTGVPIQTIHCATNKRGYQKNKGFYNGEAIGYSAGVTLKNAFFNVNQNARELIASGKENKSPMASIDGIFQESIFESDIENKVEIRFNPKEVHLFVDMNNNPIKKAEFVNILGHRAYAYGNIEYYTEMSAPKQKGDSPSRICFDTPVPSSMSLG